MIEHYKPQFTHKDWIDNQDRVQAGGEDGLNRRFHLLEAEFAGLADKVINPIIDVLGAPTRHLTLVPALIRYSDSGTDKPAWTQAIDMVQKPNQKAEAHGFMNVVLPDGALVRSLFVTGTNQSSTGTLTVALKRRTIDNSGLVGIQTLVSSTQLGVAAVPAAEVEITNASHRYFLTVDIELAELDKTVQVFCVQLVYQ